MDPLCETQTQNHVIHWPLLRKYITAAWNIVFLEIYKNLNLKKYVWHYFTITKIFRLFFNIYMRLQWELNQHSLQFLCLWGIYGSNKKKGLELTNMCFNNLSSNWNSYELLFVEEGRKSEWQTTTDFAHKGFPVILL